MSEVDELLKKVQLGIAAERFLATDVGGYMVEQCASARATALEALGEVDPENPKAIRDLQVELRCATRILEMIDEMIDAGKSAEDEINSGT